MTGRRLANTYDDYLIIERQSEVRHEFIGGEIYAMAGGTPEHGALMAKVASILGSALPGCVPFSSDVRVHIEREGMLTYPDVSFVCGQLRRSTVDTDAIINPTVLVEVTSKTTESYDRGDKLAAYQTIEALKAVVFVSHRERRITVVERNVGGWKTSESIATERVTIASPPVSFAVDDVYQVLSQMAS